MGLSTPKNKKVQEGPSELEKLKKKKNTEKLLIFQGIELSSPKKLKTF